MDIFGIDIGGSGIKGAPVNVDTGEMLAERFRIPTPVGARPEDVANEVAELIAHFKWQGPVGAGYPGVLLDNVVQTAANVDKSWIGVDAGKLFGEKTGCPVFVANDADVAGLAEMGFGAGKGNEHGVVIMLTLGTGIGTAIFIDGHLVPNTELGHLEVRGKDAEKRASDAIRQKKELSWQDWAARVNEYLVRMENLFWPNLFIIGGGVSKSSEKFFPYLNTRTKIVPAMLLNQAGTVGAALYAKKFVDTK